MFLKFFGRTQGQGLAQGFFNRDRVFAPLPGSDRSLSDSAEPILGQPGLNPDNRPLTRAAGRYCIPLLAAVRAPSPGSSGHLLVTSGETMDRIHGMILENLDALGQPANAPSPSRLLVLR